MASDTACIKMTMTQPAAPSASEIAEKQWQYILDPNILECPICFEPSSPPVYQCENGHILCSACSEKITECPSCSEPVHRVRNLAMEQIIDTLQVQCKHPGCDKMMKYTERKQHEGELCDYYPIRCPCPLPYQCKHTGPKVTIPLHIMEKHELDMEILKCPGSSTSVTLKMKPSSGFRTVKMLMCDRAWLLLHCFSIDKGCHLYCTACGVSKEVAYKLIVEVPDLNIKSEKRLHVYSMQTVAYIQQRDLQAFLIIPHKVVKSNVTLLVL